MLCHLALVLTLASVHLPDRGYNQQNPGAGLQCDAPDWALAAGTYRNSFNRRTDYAIGAWLPLHAGAWSFGLAAGPVTGYDLPVMAGLLARYRPTTPLGVNILVAPPALKHGSAMIGLQLTWRLP